MSTGDADSVTTIQCTHRNISKAHGSSSVILVDTPGLHDDESDLLNLQRIADWLKDHM